MQLLFYKKNSWWLAGTGGSCRRAALMAAPPIWCTWCCTLTFDLEIMAVSEPPVKPKAKVTFSGKFHSHVYTIRFAKPGRVLIL